MNPPEANHGLSREALEEIRRTLAPFAASIEKVGLFGSRATGRMRPQSDIDLVLHGPVTQEMVDRLWTLFAESKLPWPVDVVAYDLVTYPPFKLHIDAVELPLFEQNELLQSASRPEQSDLS
jgi:predicted nucleotidyltransferase